MKNLFTLWCGIGLLALVQLGPATHAADRPRPAQTSPAPARSQGLQIFLDNLTPTARDLAQNSLKKLTPVGVEAVERDLEAMGQFNQQLAQTNAILRQFNLPGMTLLPDDFRALWAQGCVDILRSLPGDQQQQFMNGVFGVSRAERRFAEKLVLEYTEGLAEMNKQLQRINQRMWDDR